MPQDEERKVIKEDFEVKAGLIRTFARYCEWPSGHWHSHGTNQMPPFVVGSFKEDRMTAYLIEKSKKLTIGGRELKVLLISDYNEIKHCDILYIQKTSKKKLNEILEVVDNLPILTVSDAEEYAKKGIMINLFKSGVNYRFNVNHTQVQKNGLVLSSKLLKYAVELF